MFVTKDREVGSPIDVLHLLGMDVLEKLFHVGW